MQFHLIQFYKLFFIFPSAFYWFIFFWNSCNTQSHYLLFILFQNSSPVWQNAAMPYDNRSVFFILYKKKTHFAAVNCSSCIVCPFIGFYIAPLVAILCAPEKTATAISWHINIFTLYIWFDYVILWLLWAKKKSANEGKKIIRSNIKQTS